MDRDPGLAKKIGKIKPYAGNVWEIV